MANRNVRKRARVMIIEQDRDYGIGLADWLATHGYQPVVIRSVDAAVAELSGIRPQALVVGLGTFTAQNLLEAVDVLLLLKTACPGVPAITVAAEPEPIPLVIRQASRRCLRRAVGFRGIGKALARELTLAQAPPEAGRIKPVIPRKPRRRPGRQGTPLDRKKPGRSTSRNMKKDVSW